MREDCYGRRGAGRLAGGAGRHEGEGEDPRTSRTHPRRRPGGRRGRAPRHNETIPATLARMAILELLLLLLLSSVALGWVARRFKFPYPIALVAGGAALGLVPNLPQYAFDPPLILVAVLPPI